MLRNALFAFALAGVLAAVQPVFANPAVVENARAAAPASATDHAVPPSDQFHEEVPVGLGWG